MRHATRFWAALLFTFTGAGCAGAADTDPSDPPPPRDTAEGFLPAPPSAPEPHGPWSIAPEPPSPASPATSSHDVIAWTRDGRLAIADGATGAVKDSVDPGALGPQRDLAYDAVAGRAIVFARDAAAPAGEVFAYPLASTAFGKRAHLAWVDGDTRLLLTPAGTALFSAAGIGRWALLAEGTESPLVPGPHPMSAWITTTKKSAVVIHALAYGPSSGELDVAATTLGAAALPPPGVTPLPASAGTVPPTARIVHAPARGGALLVDVEGEDVTVRRVDGASACAKSAASLGAPGMRIEAAIPFDGGEEVVLLLSGHTEIVALRIDASLAIAAVARVDLPGDPAPSTTFFSHDLAAQGTRHIVAATSAGVFSIALGAAKGGVTLAVDPGFQGDALRGPVGAIWDAPY